jgi:hypothetical protein
MDLSLPGMQPEINWDGISWSLGYLLVHVAKRKYAAQRRGVDAFHLLQ